MGGLGPLLICGGVLCLLIGAVMASSQGRGTEFSSGYAQRIGGETDERLDPIRFDRVQAAKPTPTGMTSRAPVTPPKGSPMLERFHSARLGQTVVYNHPQRGPITGQVLGRVRYTELWQRVNRPSEPWVPTGNTFVGLWLGAAMLYEWQSRLYVLEEMVPLSDADINQQFAPYAKRFAQSGQSAEITFAYPPASWTIVDIGKFEVALAEGQDLRLAPGAVGRFIHAHGADARALVVEDYQSGGGGQDTAWIGWQITPDSLQRIE